jgi:hypothetical protein
MDLTGYPVHDMVRILQFLAIKENRNILLIYRFDAFA